MNDEWYHHELIGMSVRTESGVSLGTIVEIVPGKVDILVAEHPDMVIHIPNTKSDIISISIDDGIIVPDDDDFSESTEDNEN